MEKFIPYEKLSKKEKRKMDLAKRQTWGAFDPVTRKPQNSKAYNRKRTQEWKKELSNPAFYYVRVLQSALLSDQQTPVRSGCQHRTVALLL